MSVSNAEAHWLLVAPSRSTDLEAYTMHGVRRESATNQPTTGSFIKRLM
jgi:hypothetical protein